MAVFIVDFEFFVVSVIDVMLSPQSSFESELVSEDECEQEGVVSEVETSEKESLLGGETEVDVEGDLWI